MSERMQNLMDLLIACRGCRLEMSRNQHT